MRVSGQGMLMRGVVASKMPTPNSSARIASFWRTLTPWSCHKIMRVLGQPTRVISRAASFMDWASCTSKRNSNFTAASRMAWRAEEAPLSTLTSTILIIIIIIVERYNWWDNLREATSPPWSFVINELTTLYTHKIYNIFMMRRNQTASHRGRSSDVSP